MLTAAPFTLIHSARHCPQATSQRLHHTRTHHCIMQTWASPAAGGQRCCMHTQHAATCSFGLMSVWQMSSNFRFTSTISRLTPKGACRQPPCGETRSANRTRWAGSGETTAVVGPTAPAASDLDSVQLPQDIAEKQPGNAWFGGGRSSPRRLQQSGIPLARPSIQAACSRRSPLAMRRL